jgi:two-component system, OmpR family, response regulator ArlR
MNGNSKKILVVEDEKPMARALELKLNHEGFQVKSVYNGEEALLLVKKEPFDLILLDLVMPKINGFEVLSMLREFEIKTPVIVMTNLSQEQDEKKARDLGAVNVFIKSNVTLSKVVEYIKTILI